MPNCFRSLCCILSLCIANLAFAQESATLIDFIKKVEQEHGVVFSYSPKLLKPIRYSAKVEGLALDATLAAISAALPLKFEQVGGNSVLVIPIRSALKFKVLDADDRQPIELVYVTLNNDPPNYVLSKDDYFTVEETFITDSIKINTSFYKPIQTTVSKVLQANGNLDMQALSTDLGEVTILSYLTKGVNSVLGDHRIEVDMSDLSLLAGETDGDVFQVLQAIPGIRSPNGKPGSLNLRGGPFDQNLTLFDNIPIYHTGHFFGTFSPYNPALVDKINVYRSGLPASWGGRVGGVIDIKTQDEVPDSLSVSAMLNTVSTGIELELPIVKHKLGFIFSARTRLPFDELPPKLDAFYSLNFQGSRISDNALRGPADLRDLKIDFSDLNGKLIYNVDPKNTLSLSFLSIDNNFEYDLVSPNRDEAERETSTLDNWGLTFEWKSALTDKIDLNAKYTSSSFRLRENRFERNDNGNRSNNDVEFVSNGIDDRRVDVSLDIDLAKNTDLNVGYERSSHDISFDDRVEGDNPNVNDRREGNGDISSVYFSLKHQFQTKFIVDVGLRSNHFTVGDQSFLAPKVFLTYLVSKSFFLKASATGAYQYVRQNFANDFDDFRIENQFWTLADENIPVLKGKQYMFGGLVDYGSWLFDIELYNKEVNNVIRPGMDQTGNITGDLTVQGLDFLVKKRWDGFESWISYSLSKAMETFRLPQPQGRPRRVEREAFYDQRHVLNLKLIAPVKRWNLALSWNLMSGVPVYEALNDQILGNDADQYELEYTGNFPVQHQLDMSASYLFSKPSAGWRGTLGFSIQNVYDRRNIINGFQEAVDVDDPIRFGLGFTPNIQIKVTF